VTEQRINNITCNVINVEKAKYTTNSYEIRWYDLGARVIAIQKQIEWMASTLSQALYEKVIGDQRKIKWFLREHASIVDFWVTQYRFANPSESKTIVKPHENWKTVPIFPSDWVEKKVMKST